MLERADLAIPKISIYTERRRARLARYRKAGGSPARPGLRACACVAACTQDTYVPAILRTHLHVLGLPSESACALPSLPPLGAERRENPFTRPTKLARAPLRRQEPYQLPITPSFCPPPSFSLPAAAVSSLFRASLTCGEQHRFVVCKLVGSFSRRGKKKDVETRRDGRRGEGGTEIECADRRVVNLPLSFRVSFLREYSPHRFA